MKTFLIVILAIVALAIPYIFTYLVGNWRRLIWENKGRAFRIVKKGDYYYPEKRFLRWFLFGLKSMSAIKRLLVENMLWNILKNFCKTSMKNKIIKMKS